MLCSLREDVVDLRERMLGRRGRMGRLLKYSRRDERLVRLLVLVGWEVMLGSTGRGGVSRYLLGEDVGVRSREGHLVEARVGWVGGGEADE